jgi:phospholipase C
MTFRTPIQRIVIIFKENHTFDNARSGYISRVLHSHVSLVRFCANTFGLPALNAQDRAADGMTDCFDFTRAPALPPHP